MMMLLYCTLSLFLVLRLSECALIIHSDCDEFTGTLDNGQPFTMSDIVQFKIGKTRARLFAQWLEMGPLASRTNPTGGNEGLRKTASLLFDPLLNFYTVAGASREVALSVSGTLDIGGYKSNQGLANTDTVSLLQGLLYGSTLH